MVSTFECPHCQSRCNDLISSCHNLETSTETKTFQCKDCLQLFDVARSTSEMDEDEHEDEDAGQWSDNSGEWASNEDGFFNNIYGKPSKQEETGCEA
jgi:hypothetical protein